MSAKLIVPALIATLLFFLCPSASAGFKYKVLHNFGNGTDGQVPSGPLVLDDSGDLYGVTTGGPGDYGNGTAFRLTQRKNGRWWESTLYVFTGGNGGCCPDGNLVRDSAGNLYGTMAGDSSAAISGVFDLTPGSDGWDFAVLYGREPVPGGTGPGLLMDGLGNLYGEMGPGQDKAGAIGELSPGSSRWAYTQLYSFCNENSCPDGEIPPTPPILDGKGNMFGTTTWGGIYGGLCLAYYGNDGCGVIYEMTPNGDGTWTYHVLHRFASSKNDGQSPYGGLVMDATGNFYGTAELGGPNGTGIVFKLAHASGRWQVTQLYSFPNCKIGCFPAGTPALDKAGNLYGTASGGLDDCGETCGVVFKLSPQKNGKWGYSVLHKFNGTDGAFPAYGVILDDKGNLFGVTSQFGKYGFGTAFEITP